jgi:hypothetical protein
MAEYNGHKNRAHWNVALYLFNDEGMYRFVKDMVQTSPNLDRAAARIYSTLAVMDSGKGEGYTADGIKWSKTAIRAALVGCKDTFR